ncbi:hypothetical protein ACIHDR_47230 [Nocardia sp. NPDC052278]|uniref:hypothetical protein n=1 Tax=unclassified Nocardia TaxID=2637762 RepID=UPI0036C5102C
MAATSHDMTAPRPGGTSPVYAIYGEPDPAALTLNALREAGTVLKQIPLDILVALETGKPALRDEALTRLARHNGRDLAGAVGFDDWWTTALSALNPGWSLADARNLVTDKARLHTALRHHNVATSDFHVGTLSRSFMLDAVASMGPRPVLKPVTGAGSRGVYRYRDDLTVDDNLSLYQQLLRLGHIDTQTQIIAANTSDKATPRSKSAWTPSSAMHRWPTSPSTKSSPPPRFTRSSTTS